MIRDYNLDPPDNPDMGDPCAECGEPIEEECIEIDNIQHPGKPTRLYACSFECKEEHERGWAENLYDAYVDSLSL